MPGEEKGEDALSLGNGLCLLEDKLAAVDSQRTISILIILIIGLVAAGEVGVSSPQSAR